jgi:AcrR family transcriptional regulator
MPTQATVKQRQPASDETPARQRIVNAAFSALMENGFAAANTLEIATRARVSKRELYGAAANRKCWWLASASARPQQLPIDLTDPRHLQALARTLETFGTQLLREVSDPTVIAVFRLAIAEAIRAPEVARTLNSIGVDASRAALREVMTRARSAGLLGGDPSEMAEHFVGLLWGNLKVSLLLRVTERPNPREMARRARDATAAFLKVYPERTRPGAPIS